MLSTFNSISNLNRRVTAPPVPILTTIAGSTNGLNVIGTPTMKSYVSISDDGQNICVLSSSNATQCAPCYSTNGGASWTLSTMGTTLPSSANCWGYGASYDNKYIIFSIDTNGYYPFFSSNYGATFTQFTSANFASVTPTSGNFGGNVSDDGQTVCFSNAGVAGTYGYYISRNGGTSFTRYQSTLYGDIVCSPSTGQYVLAVNNTSSGYRQRYSSDYGVTWTDGSLPCSTTSAQGHPLISDDGTKMWTLVWNGSTNQSCFCDLSVSTTWSSNFGLSQWASSYPMVVPNLSDSDASRTLKMMVATMEGGSGTASNNCFYTLDTGTTWVRIGTTFSALSTIKFQKVCVSKNGKYMILIGANNGNMYKITFPTNNV